MKQILIQWTYYADIVCVPDYIAEKINDYQLKFDIWMNDPNTVHNYWIIIEAEDIEPYRSLGFSSDAFIEWLNTFIINDASEQAEYFMKNIQPNDNQKLLPTIYF